MSKKVAFRVLIVLLLLLPSAAGAGAFSTSNVRDDLHLLTEAELDRIQQAIDETVQAWALDLAIVITADTRGQTSRDFADDYYDNNGFGVGDDHAGLLMLINMAEREIWVSTAGKAIDIFTDWRIDHLTAVVADSLAGEKYFEACMAFVDQVADNARAGVPQGQYRIDTELRSKPLVPPSYFSRVARQVKAPSVYFTAFIIAIVATLIALRTSKAQVTTDNRTYEEEGSFVITGSLDDYLRETTSRVKIARNKVTVGPGGGIGGGGGRSSIHQGSSGRMHGGGGRKF